MMDERIKRLLQWKDGERPGPYGIELAPTLRCNLDCPFCWRQGALASDAEAAGDARSEMPLATYLRILDEAAALGVREVKVIGGGESTVRRDTLDIMCAVKQRGMSGYLCTNGTLLREDDVERIVASGFDHVKMSFHAHDAALGDELLGRKGAFEKQMRSLDSFARAKRSLGTEKPTIELGVVLMSRNFRHLPEMVALAAERGADSLFIEPVTVYSEKGRALKMAEDERKEFSAIAAGAAESARSLGIATNLSNYADGIMVEKTGSMQDVLGADADRTGRSAGGFGAVPCFEPFLRMGIRSGGEVGPCGFLDEGSPENVKDRSLADIWHGKHFQALRERMVGGRLLPQCSRCCSTLVTGNRELQKAFGQLRMSGKSDKCDVNR